MNRSVKESSQVDVEKVVSPTSMSLNSLAVDVGGHAEEKGKRWCRVTSPQVNDMC